MTKSRSPGIPHDEAMAEFLSRKPAFAAKYLQTALEDAGDKEGEAVLLSVIRQIAKAKGIRKVAKSAGLPPESLSRALSRRGNPRLSTLSAITRAMGLQLTLR